MKVGVISTSRADYSIYEPLLERLQACQTTELLLFCLGMHITPEFGMTHELINSKYRKVLSDAVLPSDSHPFRISEAIGRTCQSMSLMVEQQERQSGPIDLFVCLGDRYEMFGAASAIVTFNKPLAHIHGGEVSWGAVDDKFRHALTKLADYHFPATEKSRDRIVQMGVNPDRVQATGAMGIERMKAIALYTSQEFFEKFGVDMKIPTLVATYHPATSKPNACREDLAEFCKFVRASPYQFIITLGNADAYGSEYREAISHLSNARGGVFVFDTLGIKGYHSAVNLCHMVIGNSSSGIIEAASHHKPVVNIGNRQAGREHSENLVQSGTNHLEIEQAVRFAECLVGNKFQNVYEGSRPSAQILEYLLSRQLSCNYSFHHP